MVNPGRSQRAVYLHTWLSRMRQNAPRLLRLFTLVMIFVLFAPVQAAGRQNVDVVWSNDAPLGGYQFGDFDGDGTTDLFRISGTQWQYSSGGTGAWINLANDATSQSQLRFGDFNGDGITDVFHVTGIQWRYRPGGVGAWVSLALDTTPYTDLRFGDFNGDDITDVFSVGAGGQWRYSASGTGSYQNLAIEPALTVNDLRFGYFDGDDNIDVFNRDAGGQWRYSSGGAASWVNLAADAGVPYSEMALGDFDGDGITDVFSRQPSGQWQYSKSGTDGWALLASEPAVAFVDLRFGDFDGDDKTDVFSLGGGTQPRYSSAAVDGWQNITPAVTPPPMPPGPAITAIATLAFGDFNADNVTDVFRSNAGQWQYSAGGVGEWQNLAFDPLPLNQLRFGDFNGDNKTDVFSVDGTGQWRWSDGGVSNWQNLAADTLTVEELRFGDFNGDNTTDVFSREASGQWRYRAGGLGAWINLASDPLPLADLAFGDFDGNGITDVFSIDPMDQRGRYSPNSTMGWVDLDVQNIPLNLLRFGDFDGDGKTDIFTRTDSGQWRYLSAGLLPWIDVAMDPLSINDLRFGDFNGDGRTDVFSIAPDGRWRYSSAAISNWILLGPPEAATPTYTPTFTPTGTGSPTPTFTPTGLVTPSPTPAGCYDILVNGDFESNSAWIFGDSPVPGKYTGAFKQEGLRSVQLGIVPDVTQVQSYSSIRQLIMIPAATSTVTLRWWQWAFSDEGPTDNPGAYQDRLEVIALTPGGETLRVIHRSRRNDGAWQQVMVDTTELAGKSFYLYFNLYNDGHGGRSWIFLDNMMLEVCPGDPPTMGGGKPWGGPTECWPEMNMPNGGWQNDPWRKPGKGGGWSCTATPTPTPTMTITATATPTMTPTPTPTLTTTVPITGADLSLSKEVTPTLATAGGVITYTLVITNAGPMSATNVSVMDVLPDGLTYGGSVASSGAYTDSMIGLWAIGTLTESMSATLQLTATVQLTATSPITNYAQVWTSDVVDPDSTPADNSTSQDDDDTAVVTIPSLVPIDAPQAPQPQGIQPQPQVQAQPQVQPANTPAPQAQVARECVELIDNGGFESSVGWNMLQGPAAPNYTVDETFNDSTQAMRLGILEGDNMASISAIDQMLALPMEATSIILSFRYFPMYEDDPGPGDLQYVDIYNVLTGQFAGRALGTQANDRTWLTADYDLTMQAGQTVRLVLAVNNDGVEGRSAMYVDNVSILACNFGDLVNPGVVPTPDPALGVSNQPVADQSPILLAGREADTASSNWLARLSAMGVLASVAGVIAFAVMVVIGTLRRP